MTAPAVGQDSLEGLDFDPDHACDWENADTGERCPRAAAWWHRKHCCGAVAYNCHPHRMEPSGVVRLCRHCACSYQPSESTWGPL